MDGRPENYPDLAQHDIPDKPERPTDRWWPPDGVPVPSHIIKRDLQTRKTFSAPLFRRSVERALAGRPDASRNANRIARWVLWGLDGQQVVLSSQLAVGVMDCLRRVDDIAYLRWTSIAKNMTSVTDFRIEALALMTNPSPGLAFDVNAKPRPRPTHSPGEAP